MNKNELPFSLPALRWQHALKRWLKKIPQHLNVRACGNCIRYPADIRHNRDGSDKKQQERQRTLLLCAGPAFSAQSMRLKAINFKAQAYRKTGESLDTRRVKFARFAIGSLHCVG